MRHIKKIALVTAALMLTTSAFAASGTVTPPTAPASASLELKSAPKLVSKTSTWVTLEWEKVDAASTYIVKYSTKSVANSTETNPQYDNETDPVTATGTTVENLEANTDYYFSVVAVDKDNNESDTYSDELNVKTDAATAASATAGTGAAAASSLAITNVTAQDNKTITLEFSAALGTDPVTVKITKTTDSSDVPVAEVTPDASSPNNVLVKVATVLDANSSYSVTVISAKDAAGNNIQEGVNGVKEFQTPVNLAASPEAGALDAAAGTGASMTGATATGALNGAPELPATGTKENMIVIVALMLSFGIVYGYRKRFAK